MTSKRSLVARLVSRCERQLRWLRQLIPGQYLSSLHLTLGLFAAGCLIVFGGIARELLSNGPLVRFDEEVVATLPAQATLPLTIFFLIVSALCSIGGVALVGLLVVVAYGLRRRWLYAGMWFAAVSIGEILNLILKELFARPPPYFPNRFMNEKLQAYTGNGLPGGDTITSYGFPSGHAMESVIMYGMLAYFAVRGVQSGRARVAIVLGGMFLVLSIGFSRMYLGAHYFSDVIGGYAAGGVLLSAFIICTETIRRRNTGKPPNLQSRAR
jgi:membrane-associated phospholipid phosphatase